MVNNSQAAAGGPVPDADAPPSRWARLRSASTGVKELNILLALVLLCALLAFLSPVFFSWNNLLGVARAFSLTAIAAIGQTMVIITGGIDLSAGSIIGLSSLSTGILLVKVVPVFAETFSSFGADLPAFTQFVLGLSVMAQAHWWKLAGGVTIIAIAFSKAKETSQTFADAVDRITLKVPVVGMIVNEAVIARISRTLSTTFSAGVPLVEALDSVSGAAGNAVYRDAVKRVRDDVTGGTMINVALRSVGVFPTLLIQMCAIGEESGALDTMLDKVATHYEAEVDNKVDNLTALLEPMIMSVLGILVGGLMVAMYMPIFQLGAVV